MSPGHVPSFPCGKREVFAVGKVEPKRITEARQVLKDRVETVRERWDQYGGPGCEVELRQAERALERFDAEYPEPTS